MPICQCGGKVKYVDNGPFIDQLKCTKCGYETLTYYDGYEYAVHEIKERKLWKNKNLKIKIVNEGA